MQEDTGSAQACAMLVHRLYMALDEHDYSQLEDIFCADVQFVRLGRQLDGLDAVGAALSARPADMATRHIVSNAIVAPDGPDTAHGSFYMLVVRRHGVPADAPLPIAVDGPWRLSVLRSRFRRTASGWRILRHSVEPAFEFIRTPAEMEVRS